MSIRRLRRMCRGDLAKRDPLKMLNTDSRVITRMMMVNNNNFNRHSIKEAKDQRLMMTMIMLETEIKSKEQTLMLILLNKTMIADLKRNTNQCNN
jgi:hypothetical protein